MKRNKLAKVMALLLAACMLLSACGAKEEEKQSSQPTSSASKSEAVSSEAEETKPYWEMLDEVSDTSELPDWDGETLEINIWHAAGSSAIEGYFDVTENNVYYNEIERVTGVKINWDECFDNGGNNVDAKLPMVVASGDMPTIVVGYDIRNQLLELYEEGYLANLTEYYEAGYLDSLTEKWYPMGDLFDTPIYSRMRTEDGEYFLIQASTNGIGGMFDEMEAAGYEVPGGYDSEYYYKYYANQTPRIGWNSTYGIWVRDDIIKALYPDALTMDEIEAIYLENGSFTEEQIFDLGLKNLDDFVEFLRDVKELVDTGKYVDKNGKPIEVTYGPHTEEDNWVYGAQLISFIQGAYGFDYFSYLDRNATEASQFIKRTIDCQEYVDYLKVMNQLVREDIISQKSLLDNSAMCSEKITNHSYAVTYWTGQLTQEKGMGDGYRYRLIHVANEPAEEIQAVKSKASTAQLGICDKDLTPEQVEQIVHMINYCNSEIGILCYTWGPASAGFFTVDAEGNRTLTDGKLMATLLHGVADYKDYVKDVGIQYSGGSFDAFTFCGNNGIVTMRPAYANLKNVDADVKKASNKYISSKVEQAAITDAFVAGTGIDIYGSGQVVEGLKTFWKARTGFEDQMKKVLVAANDAEFDAQLEKLRKYCDDNSFTKETMEEWSTIWAEKNETYLKAAGKLK